MACGFLLVLCLGFVWFFPEFKRKAVVSIAVVFWWVAVWVFCCGVSLSFFICFEIWVSPQKCFILAQFNHLYNLGFLFVRVFGGVVLGFFSSVKIL